MDTGHGGIRLLDEGRSDTSSFATDSSGLRGARVAIAG